MSDSSARPSNDTGDGMEAHLVALAALSDVGPARLRRLLNCGTPTEVWQRLGRGSIRPMGGDRHLTPDLLARWRQQVQTLDPVEMWRRCQALGVSVDWLGSTTYPARLADDIDPPVVLFHQGRTDALDQPLVAIVGTRRATSYGRRVAEELGESLTLTGVGVVSGLALGIDGAAHRGAVGSWGGDTAPPVAVVGAGLDVPCPARNRDVAERVVAQGLVLSEVPVGVAAAPWRFPVRNRIIAALADVVIVVESAGAGGSMHTVREALDRDRTVMAVPGPIDSRASEGTNQLISEGALVCTGPADVFVALGLAGPVGPIDPDERAGRSSMPGASDGSRLEPDGAAGQVLLELDWRPATLDELASRTGLGLDDLVRAVGELERDRWVRRNGPLIERDRRRGGPPRHDL